MAATTEDELKKLMFGCTYLALALLYFHSFHSAFMSSSVSPSFLKRS